MDQLSFHASLFPALHHQAIKSSFAWVQTSGKGSEIHKRDQQAAYFVEDEGKLLIQHSCWGGTDLAWDDGALNTSEQERRQAQEELRLSMKYKRTFCLFSEPAAAG